MNIVILGILAVAAGITWYIRNRKKPARLVILEVLFWILDTSFITLFLWVIFVQQVQDGTVAVTKFNGHVSHIVLTPGLHLVNPLASSIIIDTKLMAIRIDNDSIVTKDKAPISIHGFITMTQEPEYAWYLPLRLGGPNKIRWEVIQHAANASLNRVAASYTFEEIYMTEKKQFEKSLADDFRERLIASLPDYEKDLNIKDKVFRVYTAQIVKSVPPSKSKSE